jgi:hypothetical protein
MEELKVKQFVKALPTNGIALASVVDPAELVRRFG